MAMTEYSKTIDTITNIGTNATERGLTTQEFKAKFDYELQQFVAWFNDTHKTEFEAKAITAPGYAADTGDSDDYAITVSPAIAEYAAGQMFCFSANSANTGASTLNVCDLGAVAIKKLSASGLADTEDGDIPAGAAIPVIHNGTYFIAVGIGIGSHASDTDNPHAVTAEQAGALPLSGGTLTGITVATSDTDYTTKRIRNFRFKADSGFTTEELSEGEVGFVYES